MTRRGERRARKRLRFRYEADRPIFPVLVVGLTSSIAINGVLDTRADYCILPYEIHDAVESAMKPEDHLLAVGFTGDLAKLEFGTVDLQIQLGGQSVRWSVKVAFQRDREDEALWGFRGFLEYFHVTFYGPTREFVIRHREPERLPMSFMPGDKNRL